MCSTRSTTRRTEKNANKIFALFGILIFSLSGMASCDSLSTSSRRPWRAARRRRSKSRERICASTSAPARPRSSSSSSSSSRCAATFFLVFFACRHTRAHKQGVDLSLYSASEHSSLTHAHPHRTLAGANLSCEAVAAATAVAAAAAAAAAAARAGSISAVVVAAAAAAGCYRLRRHHLLHVHLYHHIATTAAP